MFWSGWLDWKQALTMVQPESLIRWHRRGFQLFWRRKSKPGRPRLPRNIRELIAQMARENPTWGQGRVACAYRKLDPVRKNDVKQSSRSESLGF